MTLWPHLPVDPEETLLSYADRLSMMHTGRCMERLVRDIGINTEHFISGREDAVAVFAEATGLSVEDLQMASIRVFQRGASFRGEDISKTFLTPRTARYCPACLAADEHRADRRFRLLWGFRHVSRCDRHSLWLSDSPTANATNMRLALGTSPLAEGVRADEPTPDYLTWLRGRVHGGGQADNPWLVGQTLEQILAASEMLGAILEHGHRVAVTRLSPAQTEEATDIGFSIYSEGREAVEEALDTIRQTSPATAVQAGPLAYYGKLFDWLDRRSNAIDPGPIRDILRDHIVKHSAVEPGAKVLGVEITERRFHTLYSLSAEVGIERPRLSRLLRKLGKIPRDTTERKNGNMVFEAASTVPLIKAFNTAIPLRDVPEYLGATKRQVEGLYRAGIVQPLVPRTGRGSVRNVVFARDRLNDLLQRLDAFPEFEEATGENLHPVAFACQRGAGPFEEVFSDVMAGRVRCYRNPEKSGIAALYVDVNSAIAMKISA